MCVLFAARKIEYRIRIVIRDLSLYNGAVRSSGYGFDAEQTNRVYRSQRRRRVVYESDTIVRSVFRKSHYTNNIRTHVCAFRRRFDRKYVRPPISHGTIKTALCAFSGVIDIIININIFFF